MNNPLLPADDLPSPNATAIDKLLRQQLEDSASTYFYEACDRPRQILLSACQWSVTASAQATTLVIECPDLVLNWLILRNLVEFGTVLEQFGSSSKIRICPPPGMGTPFEMRVEEISIYRDSF
ncbi:hypothetical protein [Kamptonema formosum]|uniref:hypothetical protein n=1 Tax=Kamptonema formosum TaxID=331992 RepID=UPI00034DDB93|nr:hypothetical protein [Oscillatoria sp. PCC 10802]